LKKCVPNQERRKSSENPFGDFGYRKAAGVGGDDGAGLADGFHFLQQRALDFQVFDDRLDDPVDLGQLFEIVVEIADGDEAREGRGFEEGGGLRFFGAVESGGGDFVARGTVGVGRNV
jgi:hypothetical protein